MPVQGTAFVHADLADRGVLMRSVSLCHLLFSAVVVCALTVVDAVAQNDNLAQYLSKDALTVEDQAQMDVEIADRVSSLRDAKESSDRRQAARERLIQTALINNAKEAPLSYYAERVNFYLKPLLVGDKQALADDAALVLRGLKHPKSVPSFVIGLSSKFTTTQYQCAAGIRELQPAIVSNPPLCKDALDGLARCGAKATHPALLRAIYRAANFADASNDFALGDEQTEAYADIFAARIKKLNQGATDEINDMAGVRAIAKTAAQADLNTKKKLVTSLAAYYQLIAERYSDRDVSDESIETIRELAVAVEDVLIGVMRSVEMSPPSQTYKDRLKTRRDGDSVRAVRETAAAMAEALKAEPFNLP